MSRLFPFLRHVAGHRDRTAAFREEERLVRAAHERPALDPRFLDDMRALRAHPESSLLLGHAAADPNVAVHLPLRDVLGTGHALVLGGNGSGKTRVVAGIADGLLRRIACDSASQGLWIVDHKSEFVALVQDLLADVIRASPRSEANRLLDSVVVFNPFSNRALVPFQILHPEPGVPPEVQAYEVTSLIDRLGGAELGVRQDTFLFHLVLLGITKGMTLPDLLALTGDVEALARAASGSPREDLRSYFAGSNRIAAASLEGVRARLHRLLRLPSTRLMLGAKTTVSFRSLLASKIVLADLGAPPLGCEDIGRFWSGLFTLKLTRAIFERSHDEARRPVAIMMDEFQEGLAAGSGMSDEYERILSLARSRGVSLWLISQSMALATRVSSSLPKVVATNTNVQLLFRASIEDARAMAHLLPVTGRRPKESVLPWEEKTRSPFMGREEELQKLVSEVASLPDRLFYFWHRKKPYPAHLVRARNVTPADLPLADPHAQRRLQEGGLAVPIQQLEAEARERRDTVFRPVREASLPAVDPLPPRRPRGRPRR